MLAEELDGIGGEIAVVETDEGPPPEIGQCRLAADGTGRGNRAGPAGGLRPAAAAPLPIGGCLQVEVVEGEGGPIAQLAQESQLEITELTETSGPEDTEGPGGAVAQPDRDGGEDGRGTPGVIRRRRGAARPCPLRAIPPRPV